ncbi:MAG: endo-1,4-beta-xylanase [Acidimicrobiales bacterium]
MALLATACLDDLAARRGITFGLFIQGGTELERSLALEHGDATTNHGFSWSVIQPAPDQWNFGPADATYQWAEANDLHQTGFHFAWDQDALDDLAPWVLAVTDPDELRAVLADRAATIFERYPGLDRLDVINEPFELLGGTLYVNHFHQVLGPDYVAELFAIVDAEARPSTELIINENFVEYSEAKADALVAMVTDLVARGVAIDGVGLQSHFLFGEPDWERYEQVMVDIGALGLPVHITELDVPVAPGLPDRLEVQKQRYQRAVEICVEVSACESITVWGVHDGHTWIDNLFGPGYDPLLFAADGTPKPAFGGVVEALLAAHIP